MSAEEIGKTIDEIWKSAEHPDEFMARIEGADLAVVRGLIARLGSTGTTGAKFDALRDAATALLNSKLSANIVVSVDALNRSTTRLAKVGIALTVVAVLIAFVQVIIAVCFR